MKDTLLYPPQKKNRKVPLYFFGKMVRQYPQVEQKCGLICQVNFCWI